jgi:hypothetical protein
MIQLSCISTITSTQPRSHSPSLLPNTGPNSASSNWDQTDICLHFLMFCRSRRTWGNGCRGMWRWGEIAIVKIIGFNIELDSMISKYCKSVLISNFNHFQNKTNIYTENNLNFHNLNIKYLTTYCHYDPIVLHLYHYFYPAPVPLPQSPPKHRSKLSELVQSEANGTKNGVGANSDASSLLPKQIELPQKIAMQLDKEGTNLQRIDNMLTLTIVLIDTAWDQHQKTKITSSKTESLYSTFLRRFRFMHAA